MTPSPGPAHPSGRPSEQHPDLTIATNRGDLGGGELMLLTLARAARDLGLRVRVVGPGYPADLVERAAAEGFDTVVLAASGRRDYARRLRQWDRRHRRGLLWCNGLLPVVATAGHPDRVAHLHQEPRGALQRALHRVGSRGVRAVVVPSAATGRLVPGARVLANWTGDLEPLAPRPAPGSRIGFLGRLTTAKGVDVLAEAVGILRAEGDQVELVLAGEERFAGAADRRRVRRALEPLAACTDRLGWVAPERLFSRVDVAAFPSTAAEPFGLVAAEAMGLGVPFVTSDAGALPEVVGPQHPWVARRGDPVDLAAVLRTALHVDAATRDRVVAAQRERWESHFSPAAGSARLARLLGDLDLPVGPPAGTARAPQIARTAEGNPP